MWYRLASEYKNVMIALYPDKSDAKSLAQDRAWFLREKSRSQHDFEPEPPEELHLTLAILDTPSQYEGKEESVSHLLEALSHRWAPMEGDIVGLGYFSIPFGDAVYASFDCPDLPAFRNDLVESLGALGICPSDKHGFTPHMTLGYSAGEVSGQQLVSMMGSRERTDFYGKDCEYVGKFKKRPLKMRRLVLRWGDREAGEFPLKLVQN